MVIKTNHPSNLCDSSDGIDSSDSSDNSDSSDSSDSSDRSDRKNITKNITKKASFFYNKTNYFSLKKDFTKKLKMGWN